MKNEAHLPTEQSQTQENPWFPDANEDCGRPKSPQPPPPCRPQSPRRLTLPKTSKLRTRADFRRVAKQGQRLVGQSICIDWRRSSLPYTRLGLTVSTRYGAAHERNLFKRRIREAFRTSRARLPLSLDLNIVPRQRAKSASYASLQSELIRLLGALNGPTQ